MNQPLSPLTQLSKYQIQSLIGQGTFARVYTATDTFDLRGPQRALLELIIQGDTEEKNLRRRTFQRTAEILEKLNHNSIPKAYCLFEQDGGLYLAQELIEGINYTEYLKGDRPSLSIDEIEQVFTEVLEGLAELHKAKIVHRDIKPSNLMRRHRDRSTVIVDFGSACDLSMVNEVATVLGDRQQTVGYTQIYTPGYAHPDQRDGLMPATPQWDLYALAKTIIALRLGTNPPWYQSWSIDNLGFSPRTQELLQEMLKTEGCKLIDAWDALKFQPKPVKLTTSPPQNLLKQRSKGNRLVMVGGVMTLLIAAITGGYFFFLPKYLELSQEKQPEVPQCPKYLKSQLQLPVPDRGFAARFYYPETALAGDSKLEVWRDGKLLAQESDAIRGFIWIKSMADGNNFPPDRYQMRLLVPESIAYEKEVSLDSEFPFYYLGNAAALEVACAVTAQPITSQ